MINRVKCVLLFLLAYLETITLCLNCSLLLDICKHQTILYNILAMMPRTMSVTVGKMKKLCDRSSICPSKPAQGTLNTLYKNIFLALVVSHKFTCSSLLTPTWYFVFSPLASSPFSASSSKTSWSRSSFWAYNLSVPNLSTHKLNFL